MICALALAVTLASRHFPDRNYNQRNPGVGLQCDAPDWLLAAGEYRNSFSRRTDYALAGWLPLHAGAWSFGAFAGPVTGYKTPVAGGLIARYRSAAPIGINLVLTPPAMKAQSTVLGLQLTWALP